MKDELKKYILENYRNTLKNKLNTTTKLDHEEILEKLSTSIGVEVHKLEKLNFLNEWYNNIYHQRWMFSFLENLDTYNETIFHSNIKVQVNVNGVSKILDNDPLNQEDYELSLLIFTQKNGIQFNFSNPFVSFEYQGNRITIVGKSVFANDCSKVFIRNLSTRKLELHNFIHEDFDESYFINLVEKKKNIIVTGSTASGKTSFLKTMMQHIPENDHIITIEDTHELKCEKKNITHLVASNSPNKSMKDFCNYSLRMSPERIVLGEIRSHEVIPFILSMNTGHKGLMSTIHANSAKDTLSRLTMLFTLFSQVSDAIDYKQVMKLVCSNLDVVIFLENKKVKEVIEVIGAENGQPIFKKVTFKGNQPGTEFDSLNLVC